MKASSIIVLAAIVLGGCSAPIVHHTASGRPEVTVKAKVSDVQQVLMSSLLTGGFVISKADPSLIIADREAVPDLGTALLATPMDSRVYTRLTISLVEVGHETRMVGDVVNIANRGTAFEKSSPAVPTSRGVWTQKLFDAIAQGFERGGAAKAVEIASDVAKEGRPKQSVFE